jgi:hypothetical protein
MEPLQQIELENNKIQQKLAMNNIRFRGQQKKKKKREIVHIIYEHNLYEL